MRTSVHVCEISTQEYLFSLLHPHFVCVFEVLFDAFSHFGYVISVSNYLATAIVRTSPHSSYMLQHVLCIFLLLQLM